MRESCKDIIFEGIKRYVLPKILCKNPDPEYHNKVVKLLKVKVRKMYNKRTFRQPYQADLKRSSNEFLIAQKKDQERTLRCVLQNEFRHWTAFYKYNKCRKRNRENFPMIKDHIGKLIRDPLGKAKSLDPSLCVSTRVRK